MYVFDLLPPRILYNHMHMEKKCCNAPSSQSDSNVVWTFADDRMGSMKPEVKDQAPKSNLDSGR